MLGWERWLYTSAPHNAISAAEKELPILVLLAFATGFALAGYRRLAGLAGVAWIGFYLAQALTDRPFLPTRSAFAYDLHWFALTIVPLVCYAVMIVIPSREARRSHRLGWLLGAWLLGGLVVPPGAPLELSASIGFENLLLIALLIVGGCMLAIDAWRPIAFALALLSFGLGAWTSISGIGYEHLTLALTTLGAIALIAGAAARLLSARRKVAN
ncbi:MAG TPA: hypothetical protein VGF95_11580 [Solirubrobacteraceae bacterium]